MDSEMKKPVKCHRRKLIMVPFNDSQALVSQPIRIILMPSKRFYVGISLHRLC